MKNLDKKYIFWISFTLLGILGGFLYWRFVGCKTGTCPITSTWHMSSLMGGILGYLTGDTIVDIQKKRAKKKEA